MAILLLLRMIRPRFHAPTAKLVVRKMLFAFPMDCAGQQRISCFGEPVVIRPGNRLTAPAIVVMVSHWAKQLTSTRTNQEFFVWLLMQPVQIAAKS